jgi:predicted metal-dependent peptidase
MVVETLDTADRQKVEKAGEKCLRDARTQIMMGRSPQNATLPGNPGEMAFYSVLAMKLKLEPDWSMKLCATDGERLLFNPEDVLRLSREERIAVFAHEVMHCVMQHHTRQGHRELALWNEACDLAINPGLAAAGFKLVNGMFQPGSGRFAKLPAGKTAEWYYEKLREDRDGKKGGKKGGQNPGPGEQPGEGGGAGQPGDEEGLESNDPGGNGGVIEPGHGSPAAKRESEAEWQMATTNAIRAARTRGRLPADLDRLVNEALTPKVDWKAVLREFVSKQARNDYRWMPPNRRHIHEGLYLPGMRSEELGELVIAVDTSGSIDGPLLQAFAGEITGIIDAFNASCTVVYCDSKIQHVQQINAQDGPVVLEAKGGGGTSHVPVFDWLEKHPSESPIVVCLTDLYTEFPDVAPSIPVLWCVYGNHNPKAPFGQIVKVD